MVFFGLFSKFNNESYYVSKHRGFSKLVLNHYKMRVAKATMDPHQKEDLSAVRQVLVDSERTIQTQCAVRMAMF